MSILRRILGRQGNVPDRCPHCGADLSRPESDQGICSRCAQRFARHALLSMDPDSTPANGAAGEASAQPGPQPPVNEAMIARPPPAQNGEQRSAKGSPDLGEGSLDAHNDQRIQAIEHELAHVCELLTELRRQRDHLMEELESAHDRLDRADAERRELLRLLNVLLEHRSV